MMSETELQMQVVALLNAYGRHDIEWHHVPNGAKTGAEGDKLRKMGVQSGVADLMLLIDRRAFGVELKTEIGAQSDAQSEWQIRFERAGGSYHLARGLDEVIGVLSGIGAFRTKIILANGFGGRAAGTRGRAPSRSLKPLSSEVRGNAAGPASPNP